jgi:hypothetical protein
MIVGFKVVSDDAFLSAINFLIAKHSVVNSPATNLKETSVNMLKFTTGSPFQKFQCKQLGCDDFEGWDVFVVDVEFLSINPKVDYFFNLLVEVFGLRRFIFVCLKKYLRKKGFNGRMVRVSDRDLVDYLFCEVNKVEAC